MKKSVFDIVNKYPTKNKIGFTHSEIEDVLKNFPNINREYYDKAMYHLSSIKIWKLISINRLLLNLKTIN